MPLGFIKAGIFHNYGVFTNIDKIHAAAAPERPDMYQKAVEEGLGEIGELGLEADVVNAIKNLLAYQRGKRVPGLRPRRRGFSSLVCPWRRWILNSL